MGAVGEAWSSCGRIGLGPVVAVEQWSLASAAGGGDGVSTLWLPLGTSVDQQCRQFLGTQPSAYTRSTGKSTQHLRQPLAKWEGHQGACEQGDNCLTLTYQSYFSLMDWTNNVGKLFRKTQTSVYTWKYQTADLPSLYGKPPCGMLVASLLQESIQALHVITREDHRVEWLHRVCILLLKIGGSRRRMLGCSSDLTALQVSLNWYTLVEVSQQLISTGAWHCSSSSPRGCGRMRLQCWGLGGVGGVAPQVQTGHNKQKLLLPTPLSNPPYTLNTPQPTQGGCCTHHLNNHPI